MNIHDYPEWEETIQALVEMGGTILLIGGTDTGKTTFCTLMINTALEAGRRVAIVDGDIGQSEIGPPGCVGLGVPRSPVRTLSDISAETLDFVGSVSPRGHLLEHVVAVQKATEAARAMNMDIILVDTTGMLQGMAARRLKQTKITLLAPDHVVALERNRECDAILIPWKYTDHLRIHRLPVPSVIRVKPPALRTQRRAGRFALYFQKAQLRVYNFDDVVMIGTWLNVTTPLAPHFQRFLEETLRVRVYHAELYERHLGILTKALPVGEQGMGVVQQQFRAQAITITPAFRLRHLLVGLSDGNGKVLGVGLIESLDFRRRQIGILTPIRAPAAVRHIQFGILRVKPDGSEVGMNRPGDV
jgi:polynucleotide 5'-hydroxyl-kinase GRC3/NOL9